MFQAVPPPIIRRSKTLYTASGTLSNLYCYLPLSWKSRNSSTIGAGSRKFWQSSRWCIYSLWAPDDVRRNSLKHVEHFTVINKLCNVASCWLYLKIFTLILCSHLRLFLPRCLVNSCLQTQLRCMSCKMNTKLASLCEDVFRFMYVFAHEFLFSLTFRRRIKSRLSFAGIIRRLPYSTRFQDKG